MNAQIVLISRTPQKDIRLAGLTFLPRTKKRCGGSQQSLPHTPPSRGHHSFPMSPSGEKPTMKLVLLHPDGSTEGADPRDLPREVLAQVHAPAPLLRVIRE